MDNALLKGSLRPIPQINLEQIVLTPVTNPESSPITPITPFQIPSPTPESTKKRMSISQLMTSDEPPQKMLKYLPDEPVTPTCDLLTEPLPPLRLTTRNTPLWNPLHPPLPRADERRLDALAALAVSGVVSSFGARARTNTTTAAEEKERRFVCKICNFGFHQAGGLRNHTNAVHLKQKPFGCTWPGCGRFGERGFAARGDLTRHVSSVHRGERKFFCEECNMRFARRSVLVRHLRNIHKVVVAGRGSAGAGVSCPLN